MIIEMRTYKTKPGMRSRFLEIFNEKTVPAHREIGMKGWCSGKGIWNSGFVGQVIYPLLTLVDPAPASGFSQSCIPPSTPARWKPSRCGTAALGRFATSQRISA
jgi:hypothetical protein